MKLYIFIYNIKYVEGRLLFLLVAFVYLRSRMWKPVCATAIFTQCDDYCLSFPYLIKKLVTFPYLQIFLEILR